MHSTLGIISGILTLSAGILILNVSGWTMVWDQFHNVAGLVFLFLTLVMIAFGIAALAYRRCKQY